MLAIHFPLSACWADRRGVHTMPIDRDAIDLVCMYCPDTKTCYYVDPKTVRGTTAEQPGLSGRRLRGNPIDSSRASRRGCCPDLRTHRWCGKVLCPRAHSLAG